MRFFFLSYYVFNNLVFYDKFCDFDIMKLCKDIYNNI